MDVRKLTQLLCGTAAMSSLVLMGSAIGMAGNRPHEQPTRQHMSAAFSQNWGFNRTCWTRFPEVPGCPGSGLGCSPSYSPDGYEYDPSQQQQQPQMMYSPEYGTMLHEQQLVSPDRSFPNSPISVYPKASPADSDEKSEDKTAAPTSGAQQDSDPNALPSTPAQGLAPTPGAQLALPPLPEPPVTAPGHSFIIPKTKARPVSNFGSAPQNGARYGNMDRRTMSAPISAFGVSNSNTTAFTSNSQSASNGATRSCYGAGNSPQQMPSVSQTSPAASYRSANAMPSIYPPNQSSFQPSQLSQKTDYRTMR